MKMSSEIVWTVIGVTAVAGAAGVMIYTVRTLQAGGSSLGDAIKNATTILANDVGTAVKAVLIGAGVGLLVFLLLPPPFDIIALAIVAAATIAAAYLVTDKIAQSQIRQDSFILNTPNEPDNTEQFLNSQTY